MKRLHPLYAALVLWAAAGMPSPAFLQSPQVAHAEAVRPEIGKPLQDASGLIKKQKFKEALAKIRETDSVSSKSSYEQYMIERMRISAAAGAADTAAAAHSFEVLVSTGKLSGGEKLAMMESMIGGFYRAKDYNSASIWVQRYVKEGGNNPQITSLGTQLKYMGGDYAGIARETRAQVVADEKAGRRTPKDKLELLGNVYSKLNDTAGYTYALERLVALYPEKSTWTNVLIRLQHRSGFSPRLALDLYRLKLATDNLKTTADYMETAQLALQDGANAEAKKIIAAGFASSALGAGPDAERHKRLQVMAEKRIADDVKNLPLLEADALKSEDGFLAINAGIAYIGKGDTAKGLSLIEQGLKMDNFRRPDEARLRAGVGYLMAGKKDKALATFKLVKGTDGSAELGRLWYYHTQQR